MIGSNGFTNHWFKYTFSERQKDGFPFRNWEFRITCPKKLERLNFATYMSPMEIWKLSWKLLEQADKEDGCEEKIDEVYRDEDIQSRPYRRKVKFNTMRPCLSLETGLAIRTSLRGSIRGRALLDFLDREVHYFICDSGGDDHATMGFFKSACMSMKEALEDMPETEPDDTVGNAIRDGWIALKPTYDSEMKKYHSSGPREVRGALWALVGEPDRRAVAQYVTKTPEDTDSSRTDQTLINRIRGFVDIASHFLDPPPTTSKTFSSEEGLSRPGSTPRRSTRRRPTTVSQASTGGKKRSNKGEDSRTKAKGSKKRKVSQ